MTRRTKREPERIAFTKRRLEALEPPTSGRRYVYDTGCPALCLAITENGKKTFYRGGRVQGKAKRIKIGPFPAVTVEQARDEAAALSGEVAKGQDPTEKRRVVRQQPTLGDAWVHFLGYAEQHKRPGSVKEDKALYESFLKAWAGRRLGAIQRGEVQALHTRIGNENGKVRANRTLALLSTIFGEALDIGFKGENPCKGIRRFKELARDRYLLPHEVQPFLESLQAEPNKTMRDFFAACLFTGARSGNVKTMRWEDVDLHNGFWRIPPDKAKGGEAVVVPLTPVVLGILRQRKTENGNGPWVFPGRPDGKTGHITEPKEAWKRICKQAGLEGLRIHDLRRSCGSWQAALGASLLTIGKSLGHRNQATTAIYSKVDLSPVRASLEAAEAAILLAAKRTSDLLPMIEADQTDQPDGQEGENHVED